MPIFEVTVAAQATYLVQADIQRFANERALAEFGQSPLDPKVTDSRLVSALDNVLTSTRTPGILDPDK